MAYHTPPRIRVGTDDFAELRLESEVFVDKSLMVKEFLEDTGKVILITRPRRWGKSLNMDMLMRFLAIEVDKEGKRLPTAKCLNRKLFLGGTASLPGYSPAQLQPLAIAQHGALVQTHLGQHPVISLGLKGLKGIFSYQDFINAIRGLIQRLWGAHRYLVRYTQAEDTTLEGAAKARLKRYFSDVTLSVEELTDSLRFLSELLQLHFGKSAFLFIDEYDTPINNAYLALSKKHPEQLRQVLTFFRNFFGAALKSNPHLRRGFITGILRVAKAGLFSDLNNLSEYTLLDEQYSSAYGFTEAEVKQLFTQISSQTPLEEVRHWYNGYTFGGNATRMYNPWSIMRCLASKGKLDHYWIDSGGTSLVDEALVSDEIQADLQRLVAGKSLKKVIRKQIDFNSLHTPTGLYSLLLFSGYLNPKPILPLKGLYALQVPNEEVKSIYEWRLFDWLATRLGSDSGTYYSFVRLLAEGKVASFTRRLQQLLEHSSSFHQVKGHRAELFYSGFMLSVLSILAAEYDIASEAETGLGRADALLIPKAGHGKQALVLEYKVAPTAEKLQQVAQQGLAQIQQKGYATKALAHTHVQGVRQVCIAFHGKQVAVLHAQQQR